MRQLCRFDLNKWLWDFFGQPFMMENLVFNSIYKQHYCIPPDITDNNEEEFQSFVWCLLLWSGMWHCSEHFNNKKIHVHAQLPPAILAWTLVNKNTGCPIPSWMPSRCTQIIILNTNKLSHSLRLSSHNKFLKLFQLIKRFNIHILFFV